MRPLWFLLLLFALGALPSPGWGQRARKEKQTTPVHQSNLPPERGATPLPDEVAEGKRGNKAITEEICDQILSWHATLARTLPSPLAWGVIASPIWLPILLLLFFWIRRRRRQAAPEAARSRERRAHREERAEPSRGERPRPGGPRSDRTAPVLIALNLSKDQEALVARSGQSPSLYDTFLALGPDLDSLRCFRRLVQRELDAAAWASAVLDGRATRLRSLGPEWTAAVAIDRLTSWLGQHPLVAEQSLVVQAPTGLGEREVEGLTVTRPDGLGATLDPEQKQLIYQARRALARIGATLAEPLSLVAAAGQTRLLALLPAHLAAAGERAEAPFGLGLAIRGLPALDWAIAVGLFPAELANDLRDHLREHDKLVGTPIPAEGSAVHALEGLRGQGSGEPLGLLLASVAGAAFSSGSVALRMSKRVSGIFSADAHGALERLGDRLRATLVDAASPDRKPLSENARWLLGEALLAEEAKRAAGMVKEVERWSAREPLWKTAGADTPRPPDLALATLHAYRVKVAHEQAGQARDRLFAIFERLGHAGASERERLLGAERLGFAVAAFGMPLLQGSSTELLSLGREALKALQETQS